MIAVGCWKIFFSSYLVWCVFLQVSGERQITLGFSTLDLEFDQSSRALRVAIVSLPRGGTYPRATRGAIHTPTIDDPTLIRS